VNARARALVASLRGILGTNPGATAIDLDTGPGWENLEIRTATEESALLLGAGFELGAPERIRARRQDGAWVRWVRMESREGDTRIVVIGPQEPSGEESAASVRTARSRTARGTQP
jgi:hypothetical protein